MGNGLVKHAPNLTAVPPNTRSTSQGNELTAIGDDGRTGHEAAGIGHEQEERAVEIALLTEPADRNFALDRRAAFALQIIAIEVGDDPARGDAVDADALEGEFE